MKSLRFFATTLAASACARSLHNPIQQAITLDEQLPIGQDRRLIELSPGETRWVSEDDKWELMRVCLFLRWKEANNADWDITEWNQVHGYHRQ
jgi:hypothetical protein